MLSINNDTIRNSYDLNKREDYRMLNHAYAFNSWYNADKTDEFSEIVANETALFLSIDFHADIDTIVAALIYRTVSENNIDDSQVKNEFNEDVMYKVDLLNRFNKNIFQSDKNDKELMIRTIVLDVKVAIIKLVERIAILHNIDSISYTKICDFLKDTFNFYIPIAQLLGIYNIKSNLEDLCFRYDTKYDLSNLVVAKTTDKYNEIIETVKKKLNESDLTFKEDVEFKNNKKSGYSICKQAGELNEINNILINETALKLSGFCSAKCFVKTKEECYAILSLIHSYPCRYSDFCDFIGGNNDDEYRAIHTQVFVGEYLVDFHICTKEMDHTNTYGVTSNWKNDSDLQTRLMNNYAFYKELLDATFFDKIDLYRYFMNNIIDDKKDDKKTLELKNL